VEDSLTSYDPVNYYGELGKLIVGNKCFQTYNRYLGFVDSRLQLHLVNEKFDMRTSRVDLMEKLQKL
jgi:hypothetical protein